MLRSTTWQKFGQRVTPAFLASNAIRDCVQGVAHLIQPFHACSSNPCRRISEIWKILLCSTLPSGRTMRDVTIVSPSLKRLTDAVTCFAGAGTTFATINSGTGDPLLHCSQQYHKLDLISRLQHQPVLKKKTVLTRSRRLLARMTGGVATVCWIGPVCVTCVARPSAASKATAPSAACVHAPSA